MKQKVFKYLSALLILISIVATGAGCAKSSDTSMLKSWNKDAPAIASLTEYVKDVTTESSEHFIPVRDRIAVFDLDGTLYGEKAPTYAIWQCFVERALNDPSYQAPEDVRSIAEGIAALKPDSTIPEDYEKREAEAEAKAFAGMNYETYSKFVKDFLQKNATGFDNLKLADSFFKPMLEIVDYLQKNDFTVYICSGTDRFWVRIAIEGVIDLPEEQVIGMDTTIVATGQGNDTDGLDYTFKPKDDLLRGDKLLIKNVKMNKVCQIAQEIGRQPVLSFGNSSGDFSMHSYVANEDNPYRNMAFMVIADDTEREYGNAEKAEKMKATCEENGWVTISMKDDWKTIYGDQVTKTK